MKQSINQPTERRSILVIGITLLAAMLYSCNVLPGAKEDNNNSTTVAGLAVLAASQRTSSGRAALVMPDCGKGVFTGETNSDFTRSSTLVVSFGIFTGLGLPGCAPKSSSSTSGGSTGNITMTYNSNRQLLTYTTSGVTTTYTYNSLNYITNLTQPCTVTTAGNTTVDYIYDGSGRLNKVTTTVPVGCGSASSTAYSSVVDYTYSGSDLFPTGSLTSYNSGICKTTEATTINSKNSLGYITSSSTTTSSAGTGTVTTFFPGCTPGSSSQRTMTYTYDSNGNTTNTTGSSSVYSNSSTFDSASRLLTFSSPGGAAITFNYNSVGQLTTSVSGSTTTTYSY